MRFHGLSRERSDARRYPAIDPLDSWSKYTGIIDPAKVLEVRALLRRGNEVEQMMTVVGDEGTSIEDFTMALKTDFFDNCFLQQNAFDEVDAATPQDRQVFMFDKILAVLRLSFDFDNKEQARAAMVHVSDLFRNLNYAVDGSDDYKRLLGEIDAFIVSKGVDRAAAETEQTESKQPAEA